MDAMPAPQGHQDKVKPKWLIPEKLRFVRILREGQPSGGKTYLLTFPLELTNKDYVARVLKTTELAMKNCIDACLRDEEGLKPLQPNQEDIYYFCQHMLLPPANLEYYERRFGTLLSQSNQVCLVQNWFGNRFPLQGLSLQVHSLLSQSMDGWRTSTKSIRNTFYTGYKIRGNFRVARIIIIFTFINI